MPDYVFAYYTGSEPDGPEQGAAARQRWGQWLRDLGQAVVNPGIPMGPQKLVTPTAVSDDSAAEPITGFSIINADDLDAALEIAKGCPFLEMGTVGVAQVMQM